MDDQQLDDLKQFIEATVSQTEARLEQRIDDLSKDMHSGFSGVGEAIEQIHTEAATHERRLTNLEKTA
ncbi:MAG: hypothetical protein U5K77_00325 [Candidatus Saccharibacteria bacterium]|nr:hypothetical protein [Candidatus Saccharibacteria bacterium]